MLLRPFPYKILKSFCLKQKTLARAPQLLNFLKVLFFFFFELSPNAVKDVLNCFAVQGNLRYGALMSGEFFNILLKLRWEKTRREAGGGAREAKTSPEGELRVRRRRVSQRRGEVGAPRKRSRDEVEAE